MWWHCLVWPPEHQCVGFLVQRRWLRLSGLSEVTQWITCRCWTGTHMCGSWQFKTPQGNVATFSPSLLSPTCMLPQLQCWSELPGEVVQLVRGITLGRDLSSNISLGLQTAALWCQINAWPSSTAGTGICKRVDRTGDTSLDQLQHYVTSPHALILNTYLSWMMVGNFPQ